jgi:hypothetical protein
VIRRRRTREDPSRDEFVLAALYQGFCAVTGSRGSWDPHHVVYGKHLERLGAPYYHPSNALRVTIETHANHHNCSRKIRTIELRACNIDYALELMGVERAVAYLRRYYDDATSPHPRLEALCPAISTQTS